MLNTLDVNLVLLVGVIIVNLLLVLFVYKNNQQSATNTIFSILGILISVWLIAMYFSSDGTYASLFWARLSIFVAAPMSMLFFLLAHTLPNNKLRLKKWQLLWFIVSILVIMIVNFSPNTFMWSGNEIIAMPGLLPFGFLSVSFSIAAVLVLYGRIRQAYYIEQQQLRFVMLGILFMLGLVTFTIFIPFIFFHSTFFILFAPLYVLIFLAMTAYAIVKYKFLDIRLVVARTVSFTMMIVAVAIVYTCLLFAAARYVFHISLESNIVLFAVALTVIIVLSFDTLRSFIQKVTNKIFFKEEYNSEKLLSEITHVMARTIVLDRLTNATLTILVEKMKISRAAFLIVDDHQLTDVKSVSIKGDKYQIDENSFRKLKETCFQGMKNNVHTFVFRDMEEGEQKQLFRTLGISIAMPILVKDDCVAVLLLDKKLSGEIYFQRDMDFLDVFSSGAGIAIQNAKAYQEIKKFSEELEEKVWERTKQLDEAQGRELKKAKDVARLKDEFVFIATHELRAPVTAIRMFLELLPDREKFFNKDIQEKLDSISQASDHLNHLINDILEIARSEAGSSKVDVQPTDIGKIIRDTVHELSSTAEKKKVKVLFCADDKLPQIMADPQKVTEVVTNLLSNAIKYNREGGTIKIGVLDQGAKVLIEVKDTGHGIPKEQQEKIFQKFFRASSRETSSVLGTGLGLFITRMLVEKMGGKIMFSSVQGKGTTFAFSLPKAKDT